MLVTPGLGYSEQERSRMKEIALPRINSFASEPDTGFPPGNVALYELVFSSFMEAV